MPLSTMLTLGVNRTGNSGPADINALSGAVRSLGNSLKTVNSRTLREASAGAALLTASNGRLSKATQEVVREYLKQLTASQRLRDTRQAIVDANKKERDSLRTLSAEYGNAASAARKYEHQMRTLRATALDMSYIFGRLGRSAGFMAAGMLGGGIGIGVKAVGTHARFEDYRSQLKAVGDAYGEMWEKTRKFALQSPLTFEDTVQGVIRLKQYGERTDTVFNTLLATMTKISVFSKKPLAQVVGSLEAMKTGTFRRRELNPMGITPAWLESIGLPWDAKKGRPAAFEGASLQQMSGIFDKIMEELVKKYQNYHPETLLRTLLANMKDALDLGFDALGASFDKFSKPFLTRAQKVILDFGNLFNDPGVQAAIDKFVGMLAEAFGKMLTHVENLIAAIQKDPEIITRWLTNITNAFKGLLAVAAGGQLAAFVASIIQLVATVKLAFASAKLAGGGAELAAILGLGPEAWTVIGILAAFVVGATAVWFILKKIFPAMTAHKEVSEDVAKALQHMKDAGIGIDGVLTKQGKAAETATPKLAGFAAMLERINAANATAAAMDEQGRINTNAAVAGMVPASGSPDNVWTGFGSKLNPQIADALTRTYQDDYNRIRKGLDPLGDRSYIVGQIAKLHPEFFALSPSGRTGSKLPRYAQGQEYMGDVGPFQEGALTRNLLRKEEGYRTKAYSDTGGVLTIGIGHTGSDVKAGATWSAAQIDKAYQQDVAQAQAAVRKAIKVPLTENQMAALTSIAFQWGHIPSSIAKAVNSGDPIAGARAIRNLVTHDRHGNVVSGGRNQRAAAMFASGDSTASPYYDPTTGGAGAPAINEDLQKLLDSMGDTSAEYARQSKAPGISKETGRKLHEELIDNLSKSAMDYIGKGGSYADLSASAKYSFKEKYGEPSAWTTAMAQMNPHYTDEELQKLTEEANKQRIEEETTALDATKDIYSQMADRVKDFVDRMKDQVERMTKLAERLGDARDNLAVSLQNLMGFDRGADATRANQLARKLRAAKARYDANPTEDNLASFGEAGLALSEFGGSMRKSPGKDGKLSQSDMEHNAFADFAVRVLQETGVSNPAFLAQLEAAQMTVQQKIDQTNSLIATEINYLAGIQAQLGAIAAALGAAKIGVAGMAQGIGQKFAISAGQTGSVVVGNYQAAGGTANPSDYYPMGEPQIGQDASLIDQYDTLQPNSNINDGQTYSAEGEGTSYTQEAGDTKKKGGGVAAALQRTAGIINAINGILTASKDQMGTAIGSFLDALMPGAGGIFSALGGLFDTLTGGGGKKGIVVDRILQPVKTLPQSTSIFGAQNPAGWWRRGESRIFGAAAKVVTELRGDAKHILKQWVEGEHYGDMILAGV